MGDTSSLDFMRSRKVFEINPEHEIIKGLNVSLILLLAISLPSFRLLEQDLAGKLQSNVAVLKINICIDEFIYSL